MSTKTPEEIAQATLDNHAIKPHWNRSGEQIAELIVEAIEADRAQRPDSTTLKKAYDRWSEVFEGEEYCTDAQERATQLDLAENLREYMEQIEGGWL